MTNPKLLKGVLRTRSTRRMIKVKDFIHDIGEKIEGAIGFGKPTADVTGLHVPSINLEKAEFVIEILKRTQIRFLSL